MTVASEPGSENPGPLTDSKGVAAYTESLDYPVLQYVLLNYFGSAALRRADRSSEFVEKYQVYGETTSEFEGLAAELGKAIKSPQSATPMLNEALGTDLEPFDVREHLSSLLDQITNRGEFDDGAAAERERIAQEATAAVAPSPDDLLNNYFWRKVRIPVPILRDHEIPLWMMLVAGFVIAGLGIGLANLPLPGWLSWIPLMFIVLGLVVVGLTAGAMRGLREELRRPEKEARRAAEQEEAAAKRAERKTTQRRLTDYL